MDVCELLDFHTHTQRESREQRRCLSPELRHRQIKSIPLTNGDTNQGVTSLLDHRTGLMSFGNAEEDGRDPSRTNVCHRTEGTSKWREPSASPPTAALGFRDSFPRDLLVLFYFRGGQQMFLSTPPGDRGAPPINTPSGP